MAATAAAAILLLVLLPPPAAAAGAASVDVAALMALKDGLRDPNGELASWVRDPDLPNPCNWSHITCDDGDHRVTGMEITWNLIEGSIPPDLGQLENLISLDLNGNWITGPISPHLGNLQSLVYMRIDHNRLTGQIPLQLGRLPNLLDL
uniref:Leucine-rich repeat-containing N-terminal plant-type domain-containing protein n=1 Tax=Leersia perrieri TaxID=77586 RepID=A0A0D9WI25_9ORYZ